MLKSSKFCLWLKEALNLNTKYFEFAISDYLLEYLRAFKRIFFLFLTNFEIFVFLFCSTEIGHNSAAILDNYAFMIAYHF